MAGLDPSFPAKKPVALWNKTLKVDSKGLFRALSKGALHGFTAQWTSLGGDAVDLLSSLGIDSQDAPQIAWILIRRSLLSAMADLVQEIAPLYPKPDKKLDELSEQLDAILEKEEVTLDRSFFERPAALPLLGALQKPFSEWLQCYGLPAPAADAIAQRLPSYFVVALHSEWRRSAATYEPVREAVDTPFTRAADRERAWSLYAAHLQRQVDEPMFGEAFGLRQVYVPLRAFYFDKSDEGQTERFKAELREQAVPRIAVNLTKEIDTWLEKGDRRDGYRVLSGGPGSGKSSFARMYAARLAESGKCRLLFIPLHQLNLTGSLVASVGEYVRMAEILPVNPLDPETGEDRLLILFDGLDELAQQGRVAAETARDFVREVLKAVEIRNDKKRRLLVIFTGREPVVQASESELRDPRCVLHVLPYSEDQRDSWWKLYGKAKGAGYSGLPKELNRPELGEITAQPLLNYLVALSVGRGQLDFSKDLNLNDIYEDLLKAVHARTYEQRQHAAIQGFRLEEFKRVLEEIALSAWHGNGRTTTVAEIESHCQAAGLSGLLERFAEGAKAGVTRVLTAFYFRQYGRTAAGDATFEFTHKSFREYLTALRILRALERIEEEVRRREESFDAGWDERSALKHWAEVCGPTTMDFELWRFVSYEVSRHGKEKAESWQKLLCRLIAVMLRIGMPLELLSPRPTYLEESRQARNSEEALLAVLNACAHITETLSQVDWPETDGARSTAGAWIGRLRGQRIGPENGLALRCLSWLDLSRCVLFVCDLYGADLRSSKLAGAHLFMANLQGAILQAANLQEAHLGGADLQRASLLGAHLREADLREADLRGADLQGADLQGADLRGAHIEAARIDRHSLAQIRGKPIGKPRA